MAIVQVPTANSAFNLIKRDSFSSVAGTSTTFDGVFTSTYSSYLIVIENIFAATAADNIQFVFRVSGSDASAHYGNCLSNAYNSSTFTNTSSANAAQLTIFSPDVSTPGASGQIFVENIGTNLVVQMNGRMSSLYGAVCNFVYGKNDASLTYTGFRLKSESSNITGTVAVYGLAK